MNDLFTWLMAYLCHAPECSIFYHRDKHHRGRKSRSSKPFQQTNAEEASLSCTLTHRNHIGKRTCTDVKEWGELNSNERYSWGFGVFMALWCANVTHQIPVYKFVIFSWAQVWPVISLTSQLEIPWWCSNLRSRMTAPKYLTREVTALGL